MSSDGAVKTAAGGACVFCCWLRSLPLSSSLVMSWFARGRGTQAHRCRSTSCLHSNNVLGVARFAGWACAALLLRLRGALPRVRLPCAIWLPAPRPFETCQV